MTSQPCSSSNADPCLIETQAKHQADLDTGGHTSKTTREDFIIRPGDTPSRQGGKPLKSDQHEQDHDGEFGCPLCEHRASDARPYLVVDKWTLLSCPTCKLVYLNNPPTASELSSSLTWSRTFMVERARRAPQTAIERVVRATLRTIQLSLRPNKLLRLIRRYLPQGGKVVDIGCGRGHQTLTLPESIVPFGIEIDPEAASVSDPLFRVRGGNVVSSAAIPALESMPRGSMNGAILMAYLEHESSPRQALKLLRGVLAEGAPVFIKVPNHSSLNRLGRGARWCGYRFPDHVAYYTPHTLSHILKKSGFSIEKCGFTDRLPTSDNLWVVAKANA